MDSALEARAEDLLVQVPQTLLPISASEARVTAMSHAQPCRGSAVMATTTVPTDFAYNISLSYHARQSFTWPDEELQ